MHYNLNFNCSCFRQLATSASVDVNGIFSKLTYTQITLHQLCMVIVHKRILKPHLKLYLMDYIWGIDEFKSIFTEKSITYIKMTHSHLYFKILLTLSPINKSFRSENFITWNVQYICQSIQIFKMTIVKMYNKGTHNIWFMFWSVT